VGEGLARWRLPPASIPEAGRVAGGVREEPGQCLVVLGIRRVLEGQGNPCQMYHATRISHTLESSTAFHQEGLIGERRQVDWNPENFSLPLRCAPAFS